MTDRLTPERLAEIRERDAFYDDVRGALGPNSAEHHRGELLGEIDRLTAENRLFHAIYDRDHPRPDACPKLTVHPAHRWLPPRSALDCPGRPGAITEGTAQ